MECEQCSLVTKLKFVCPDCSKNTGEKIKFYVCDTDCQKLFWKKHKMQGHRQFPLYFEELGKKAECQEEEISRVFNQLQIGRQLLPFELQIEFENADLQADNEWFVNHWEKNKEGLIFHALASFGAFQWKNFRGWLLTITLSDNSSKEALRLFRNHPAFDDDE